MKARLIFINMSQIQYLQVLHPLYATFFLFSFYLLFMIQVVFLSFFPDSLAPIKQPFSSLSIRLKVALFILFTPSYIASHGLASSYLGDLLGFLKFLLHFELCFRQSPVVLSMMGYVHWGWLLASLHPSSEELLHPTHIC